jgi:hypothetical protein
VADTHPVGFYPAQSQRHGVDRDSQDSQAGGNKTYRSGPESQVRDIKEGREEVCKCRCIMKNGTIHVSPHKNQISDFKFQIPKY